MKAFSLLDVNGRFVETSYLKLQRIRLILTWIKVVWERIFLLIMSYPEGAGRNLLRNVVKNIY
jgi:hypothetical protein